ncbi:MAG: type II toxin-antitoxin system VapC family toxin [Bacteroidota bacterium]
MGDNFLIDSNVVSDYFANKFSINGNTFFENIITERPNISFINQIELLSHNLPSLSKYKIIFKAFEVLGISDKIIDKTIAIRKSRKIKLTDAIIAATAITLNLTLITHNLSDFEKIANLKILDLHSL